MTSNFPKLKSNAKVPSSSAPLVVIMDLRKRDMVLSRYTNQPCTDHTPASQDGKRARQRDYSINGDPIATTDQYNSGFVYEASALCGEAYMVNYMNSNNNTCNHDTNTTENGINAQEMTTTLTTRTQSGNLSTPPSRPIFAVLGIFDRYHSAAPTSSSVWLYSSADTDDYYRLNYLRPSGNDCTGIRKDNLKCDDDNNDDENKHKEEYYCYDRQPRHWSHGMFFSDVRRRVCEAIHHHSADWTDNDIGTAGSHKVQVPGRMHMKDDLCAEHDDGDTCKVQSTQPPDEMAAVMSAILKGCCFMDKHRGANSEANGGRIIFLSPYHSYTILGQTPLSPLVVSAATVAMRRRGTVLRAVVGVGCNNLASVREVLGICGSNDIIRMDESGESSTLRSMDGAVTYNYLPLKQLNAICCATRGQCCVWISASIAGGVIGPSTQFGKCCAANPVTLVLPFSSYYLLELPLHYSVVNAAVKNEGLYDALLMDNTENDHDIHPVSLVKRSEYTCMYESLFDHLTQYSYICNAGTTSTSHDTSPCDDGRRALELYIHPSSPPITQDKEVTHAAHNYSADAYHRNIAAGNISFVDGNTMAILTSL